MNLYNRYKHWLKPEALEQANLVLWLESKWYTYTSIPNSTWTKSIKQKIVNKLTWLKPWLCDMLIILKRGSILFIELKRQKRVLKSWKLWKSPSVISKEQLHWIKELNKCDNVEAQICYWAKEAIEVVEKMENL